MKILFAIAVLFAACIRSETINRITQNDYTDAECTQSGDCIINCMTKHSCLGKIHCHKTLPGKCIINFLFAYAGEKGGDKQANRGTNDHAKIYTHFADVTEINTAQEAGKACRRCEVYAYEKPGAQLYLQIDGKNSFDRTTIYTPFGKGSYLSYICRSESCQYTMIYQDWTTTIYMQPTQGYKSFQYGQMKNIFDDLFVSTFLSISRKHYDFDSTFRAPVHLNGCDNPGRDFSWGSFKFYGKNHGDWLITNNGRRAFNNAIFYLDSDLPPNSESEDGHYIRLIGASIGGEIVPKKDPNTENGVFAGMTIYAGNGYVVEAEVSDINGLRGAQIIAPNAKSVVINCRHGSGCGYMKVTCPTATDSICKIWCDAYKDGNMQYRGCGNMQITVPNGYCQNNNGIVVCTEPQFCKLTHIVSGAQRCKFDKNGVCKSVKKYPTLTTTTTMSQCANNVDLIPLEFIANSFECPQGSLVYPLPVVKEPITTLPPPQECITNEQYNIQFLLDESESIAADFDNVKQLIKNIITRDINIISTVSILSFGQNNVYPIWSFGDIPQYPRDPILSSLENKNLRGGIADVYKAMQKGIAEFNIFIAPNYNNFMVLTIDSPPKVGGNYVSPCELKNALTSSNIQLVVITVGMKFDQTGLRCLTDHYYETTEEVLDMSEFSPISTNLYDIFCDQPTSEPTVQPTPEPNTDLENCDYTNAPGFTQLTQGNVVHSQTASQDMEFEFDIVIDRQCRSTVCNIFELGSDSQVAASLSINGADQSLRLIFGCDDVSKPVKLIKSDCIDINDGNKHHIYIKFTKYALRFDLDYNTLYHEESEQTMCSNLDFQKEEYSLSLANKNDMTLAAKVYNFCFVQGDRQIPKVAIPKPTSRQDAESACQQYGLSLASIISDWEHEAAMDALKAVSTGIDGWIGLIAINNNQIYEWSDSTTCDYAPQGSCNNDPYFASNQPDSSSSCVEMEYNDGTYSNEDCSDFGYPICNDPDGKGLQTTVEPTFDPVAPPVTASPTQEPVEPPTTTEPSFEPTSKPTPGPTHEPSTSEPTIPSQPPTGVPSTAPTMVCDYQENGPKITEKMYPGMPGVFKINLEDKFKFKFDYEIKTDCPESHCNLIQIGMQDQTFLKIDADDQQNWNIQLATSTTTNSPVSLNSNNPPPIVDNQKHYLEILVNTENVIGIRIKIDNSIIYQDANYNIPSYISANHKDNVGQVFLSGFADPPLDSSLSNICVQSNGPLTNNVPAHSINHKSWPVNNNNFGAIKNNHENNNDVNYYYIYYYYIGGFISGLVVLFITEIFIYLCYYYVKKNNGIAYIEPISQYEDEEKPIKEEVIAVN